MRATAKIVLIICLLFLVGTVGAIDKSFIDLPSKEWVIANGADQSTITVHVQNSTGAVEDATVTFSVDNPDYGSMNPEIVTSDEYGMASSTFKVNKTSGTAIITATINYDDAGTLRTAIKTISQKIDHDINWIFSPTSDVPDDRTVGTIATFNVLITDEWGNLIDNKNPGPDHAITLSVSCPMPNDCEFVGVGHYLPSAPLGENGDLEISLKLGNRTGTNIILMDPLHDLNKQMLMIDTIPDVGILEEKLNPAQEPPYEVPVGTGILTFSYTLSDKYDNPVANEPILINIPGETEISTNTSAFGQTPLISYGPKGSAGILDITATVKSNTSITHLFSVAFVNVEPTVSLSVSPLNMGSSDYDSTFKAVVTVRVGDDMGNPISEPQDIQLTLDSCTSGDQNWTTPLPYLGPPPSPGTDGYLFSGTTGSNGEMTTEFTPGAIKSGAYWHESCVLTAKWISDTTRTSQPVTLTWSNHPYLDVSISTSPQNVQVNEEFDVTVCIAANGNAGNGPLTIVIDQDATSNLGRSIGGSPTTMEQDATAASKVFIGKLSEPNTRIGMETFGKATTDAEPDVGYLDIPSTFSDMETELDKLASLKLLGGATGYYDSLIRSEDKIINDGHPENLKFIIFLSDGGQDLKPEEFATIVSKSIGDGTDQQKIRIMTLCYTNNAFDPSGAKQLADLSHATGGEAYIARNADELAVKFDEIFQFMMELMGEGSEMTIDFENIDISPTEQLPGSDVYDYIPRGISEGYFDDVIIPDPAKNDNERTKINWPDGTQSVQNQSIQWPDLQFAVGKVDLKETWCTTFRLKAKQAGCYNAFGKDSTIDLGLGLPPEPLPPSPICIGGTVTTKTLTGTLDVWNLKNVTPPLGSCYTDFISLEWNTKYNSTISTNFATEIVSYSIDNGKTWKQVDVKTVPTRDPSSEPRLLNALLDVRYLPSGSYDFKVYAHAEDAEDDNEPLDNICVDHGNGLKHINLT